MAGAAQPNEIETYFSKSSYHKTIKTHLKSRFFLLYIKDKVMSPIKKEADPNLVAQFCQKLNRDFNNGISTAIHLIINKMQSEQEWESLIALYVSDKLYLYRTLAKKANNSFILMSSYIS